MKVNCISINERLNMRRLQIFGAMLVLALLCVLTLTSTAHAATFIVDSTGDQSDGVPGNGVCLTIVNTCTLRAAIEEANAFAGADTVNFNIAGAGVQTITPTTTLPAVVETITIDGSTQSGATCGDLVPDSLPAQNNTPHNLLIQITRTGDDSSDNILSINTGVGEDASNSTIRGLVINSSGNNSSFTAININSDYNDPNTNITVECNYIGTNPAGTSSDSTTNYGVYVQNIDYINIADNLISVNGDGTIVGNSYAAIETNLIGTDISGNVSLNQDNGIVGNLYGDTNPSRVTGNIISGNQAMGMNLGGSEFIVNGNYIGVSMSGTPLGNGSVGMRVDSGSSDYTIGGATSDDRNVISANQGNGLNIYNYHQIGDGCPNTVNYNGKVWGNLIGTNASGAVQAGFGNTGSGIQVNETIFNLSCVQSIYKIQIGGIATGNANVIAGNTQDGVRIFQNPGADVFSVSTIGNSIFSNGNLGINLAADSTGSGTADTDLGPNVINNFLMSYPATNANYYINHAVINSTSYTGNQLTVNYNFQANGVEASGDGVSLLPTDLVGYRLDFYLNDNAQDGAYEGYNQGKTHLGSFIVDGSETNATHTFTSPVTLTANQSVSSTVTALWENMSCPNNNNRGGDGPPYSACSD